MFSRILQFSTALCALSPLIGVAQTSGTIASSVMPAAVLKVQSSRIADLVLVNGGFETGFRQGMVCRISHQGHEVAEIILVDLRSTCASALILNISQGQLIQPGDIATVKTLKI